ncbi:MAG: hypothetical protein HY926_13915 [Elusimicrobia bacterium]|nr:hypothetical protein [Elusimicrobiota bacterium]
MKLIPSIAVAAVMLFWPLARAHAALSPEDKQFLKSCQVIPADIDIIPKLSQTTQDNIARWIQAKDCGRTGPLRASRAYYRKLDVSKPIPLLPPGWSVTYLTEEEFKNYINILDNAPW